MAAKAPQHYCNCVWTIGCFINGASVQFNEENVTAELDSPQAVQVCVCVCVCVLVHSYVAFPPESSGSALGRTDWVKSSNSHKLA